MDITAFIMGICPPKRLGWLKQNLDFLDSQNFPFAKKILAIDQFRGYTFPKQMHDKFSDRGWEIIIDNHQSRTKTMDHILDIETEYMFYHEDDVLSTMPAFEDVETVFNLKVDGRECGIISLTVGGSDWIIEKGMYGDIELLNENILLRNDDYVFFRRLEEHRNNCFFEFPGLLIRTNLFKKCHLTAKMNRTGYIEEGLTTAYFQNNIHESFYKCSVTKPEFLETLLKSVPAAMENCRMLRNLDVNQGTMSIDGQHFPFAHNY